MLIRQMKSPIKLVTFILLFLILINKFFNISSSDYVNAKELDWEEVPSSQYGRQWWEKSTLKHNNDDSYRVFTRYQPISIARNKDILFIMDIDCSNNQYKDISINGKYNKNSNWLRSDGDKLIDGVIDQVCQSN
tara:strand:+ start:9652 stop:10053 length:402 start_codon:yes stop_codon:yes gene_type:complete